LIRVADDTTVWTHQYDAGLSDLFAVQADIAHQITSALEVALDARERLAVEARPTEDFDAYFAYLRGIVAFRQGFSDTSNQAAARTAFEEAVARDPEFALAWSWLSRVYEVQYASGAARTTEVRQAAHRAAETAVALQPGLPEAHLALAEALAVDGDMAGAGRELDLARIGLPNSPDLWQLRGFVEQSKGRWLEARTALMRAFDLDPASNANWVAVHYLHMRQFDDARRFVDIAKAANHSAAAVPDAWIHVTERGDIATARAVLESALEARSPGDARVRGLLAHLEWFDGRHDRALELIAGMDAAGGWLPPNFRFPASLAAGQVLDVTGRTREARENYAAAMAELKGRRTIDLGDHKIEAGLALAAAGLGRRTEALAHATRAVDLVPPSTRAADWPLYAYLLARVQSRVGDYDAAFATLEELFTRPGFYSEHWVIRDPWFAPLRSHPSFEARLQRWASQKGDVLLRR
jgi:tetratricopeptide (TPR) repeat protein